MNLTSAIGLVVATVVVPLPLLLVIARHGRQPYYRPGEGGRYLLALKLFAALYYAGLAVKYLQLGPQLLRWHLLDLLAPTFYGMTFHEVFGQWRRLAWPVGTLAAKRQVASHRQYYIGVGWLVAVLYEAFGSPILVSWQQAVGLVDTPVSVGNFDWWDILAYSLGAAIGLVLLGLQRRTLSAALQRGPSADRPARPTQTTSPAQTSHPLVPPEEPASSRAERRNAQRRGRRRGPGVTRRAPKRRPDK